MNLVQSAAQCSVQGSQWKIKSSNRFADSWYEVVGCAYERPKYHKMSNIELAMYSEWSKDKSYNNDDVYTSSFQDLECYHIQLNHRMLILHSPSDI